MKILTISKDWTVFMATVLVKITTNIICTGLSLLAWGLKII